MSAKILGYFIKVYVLLFIAYGQVVDNRGRSYLLAFLPNFNSDAVCRLVVTSAHNVTVYIFNPSAPAGRTRSEHSVQAGGSLHVTLEGSVTLSTDQVPENKTVLVVASEPVSVFGFSSQYRSSDGFLSVPMEALGTHYVIATYGVARNDGGVLNDGAQLAVAATEDDTEVIVTLRVMQTTSCGDTLLRTKDESRLRFVLQARQAVRVLCDGDITGSHVTSSRPVAVWSGNKCATVPTGRPFCDHLVEMMVPVSALGSRYLLHAFQGRSSGAIYRVIPAVPNAAINYGAGLTPFQFGNLPFHEFTVGPAQTGTVSSESPLLVVGYSLGQQNATGSDKGDPLMAVLPSPDLAPNRYVLDVALGTNNVSDSGRAWRCFVTAVTSREFAAGVRVGDRPLSMTAAEDGLALGSAEVSMWPVSVTHDISTAAKVAMMTYCFADGEGLGFPAGLTLHDFTGKDECVTSPCQNKGVCYNLGSKYQCHCLDIYGGTNCTEDVVDDCRSGPCINGGSCQDRPRSFTCLCPPQFTGPTCGKAVTTSALSTATTTPTTTPTSSTTTTTTTSTTANRKTTATTTRKPGGKRSALCPCSCSYAMRPPPPDADHKQEQAILEIQEELTIDVKNTSRDRGKRQSASDTRTSATEVGLIGVSLVALILSFIVAMDAASLLAHLAGTVKTCRARRSLRASKRQTQAVVATDGADEKGPGHHSSTSSSCGLETNADATGRHPGSEAQQYSIMTTADGSLPSRVDWQLSGQEGMLSGLHAARPLSNRLPPPPSTPTPPPGGSDMNHLLQVRPETIVLHVRQGAQPRTDIN